MMSALSHDRPAPPPSSSKSKPSTSASTGPLLGETPPVVVSSSTPSKPPTAKNLSPNAASPQVAARPPPIPKAERPRPKIRAAKAAITLVRHLTRAHRLASLLNFLSWHGQTPAAVERLQNLLKSPTPQMIRIGVRNKGCAGLSYHLEYVEQPAKFDEVVEQDGVKVVIDSKALFSIIGSEMDWQEDGLRYVLLSLLSVSSCELIRCAFS